ncbi:hypothetical protein EPO44_21195 [bacterium]|nr:MAG: hypothetical protein EPO44_21195 [bacterium]
MPHNVTIERIPLAYRTENGQKGIIVARFEKHFLPVISPGHDVKEKTWRVDTAVTRHEGKVAPTRNLSKSSLKESKRLADNGN